MTDPHSPVPLEVLLAHRAWVRTVARALVADANDADEIEQETWLAAVRRPPHPSGSVRGWLGAVARNVARRLGRDAACRERYEAACDALDVEEPAADLVAEAELQQRIGSAVLELEEPFRSTVLLRYFDDLPPRRIAARQGVSVETVRSRLRRARERLRARLDAAEGDRRGAWAAVVLAWRSPSSAPVPLTPAAGTAAALGGLLMNKAAVAVGAVLLVAGAWFAVRDRSADAPPGPREVGEASTAANRPADAAPPRRGPNPVDDTAPVRGTGDDLPPPVDLERADRELDLHGTVVDASGRGVAGAGVATVTYPWRTAELLNMRDYDREIAGPATRSSRDGSFSVRLARGQSVALRVSAEGFASTELPHVLAGERLRVTLRPGVRLVVDVKDADGAPVAGASLDVHSGDYDEASPSFHATGATGPDGVVTVDGLPSGARARLSATHRTKGVGWVWNLDLPPDGELRREMRLKPARVLRGRVVDVGTRVPIAGAEVGRGWTLEGPVTTGPDGEYELPGWTGDGETDLHVRAEGYATDGKVVGAAERIDFELARGYAAIGRVLGADRQPVAGALVSVIASSMDDEQQQISHSYAESGADGQFRVTSLRVGMRHVVVVLASGHARLRRETPTASTTNDVDLGDLVLAEPRRVEGVVVGADGAPQPRQTVFLSGPLTGDQVGSFYGRSVTVATDDLGRFRFAEVEPGSYEVVVRPAGSQEIRTRVQVSRDRDVLDIRIERAALREVSIAVTDPEGKPLAGVFVGLTDSNNKQIQERTDAAGVAHVTVPAGHAMTWSVYPPQDGTRTYLQPAWQPLPQDRDQLSVALEEAAFATGLVLDPGGSPVARAWLQFVGSDGDERWTETDVEGRFRVHVRRASRSTVVFDGSVHVSGARQDSGLAARLEGVAAGEDVVVRCTRVALDRTLIVIVVSPQGEPVPKASVGAVGSSGSVSQGVWPQTDDAGRLTLRDLPARSLRIHVSMRSAEFLEPAPVSVVPDGQELRLVCRTATRITGAVVDKSGTPLPFGSARAERNGEGVAWTQIDREGRFALLLPDTDTLPVRLVIERNNDGTPEAALDGVAPGTQGLRMVVGK